MTALGQQLVVVGSGEALGDWDLDAGLAMTWSDGHIWTLALDAEVGDVQGEEFKVRGAVVPGGGELHCIAGVRKGRRA